jgi:protein TonB
VSFVLNRSGGLISTKLLESSGLKVLDLEAVAMIEHAQPFPVPPPDIDDDKLKLAVTLVFDGKAGMSPPDIQRLVEIGKGEARMKAMLHSICRGC